MTSLRPKKGKGRKMRERGCPCLFSLRPQAAGCVQRLGCALPLAATAAPPGELTSLGSRPQSLPAPTLGLNSTGAAQLHGALLTSPVAQLPPPTFRKQVRGLVPGDWQTPDRLRTRITGRGGENGCLLSTPPLGRYSNDCPVALSPANIL